MVYIDTHAHIFSQEFQDDFEQMIERSFAKNVKEIVIITTEKEEAYRAIDYAKQHDFVKVAFGIHPEFVNDANFQDVEELANNPWISMIGEIGLDYYWVKDNAELQKEFFIRQIELARKVKKPIIVHSRDAHQDTFDILKNHRIHGLLHCFSGSYEMAKEYTKLGYYIALGGAVTFKNSVKAKEVGEKVDINYLLTETDCPYMAPVPVRGTRNEPSNIPYIAEYLAGLRNMEVSDFEKQIEENYHRFLNTEVE